MLELASPITRAKIGPRAVIPSFYKILARSRVILWFEAIPRMLVLVQTQSEQMKIFEYWERNIEALMRSSLHCFSAGARAAYGRQ